MCSVAKMKTKTELSQKCQTNSAEMRSITKMVAFRRWHSKVAFCLCFTWCPTPLPSLLWSGCKMVLCFCRMFLASSTAHPFPPWSWPVPSAMLCQQPQPGQCRHVVSIAQNKTPALSLSRNRRHFSLLVNTFFTELSIFLPQTLRPAQFMLIFNYYSY